MNAVKPLLLLSEMAHQLQRERGTTAVFIDTAGKVFSTKLDNQYTKTDQCCDQLNHAFGDWEADCVLRRSDVNELKKYLATFESLAEIRGAVLNLEAGVSSTMDFYTHHLIAPLLQFMVKIAYHGQRNDPVRVSAYNAFLQWKERLGLERAVGSRVFGSAGLSQHNFIKRMLLLISEQKHYQDTFFVLASTLQKKLVLEMDNAEEEQRLNHLHELIQNYRQEDLQEDVKPQAWFELITVKIDALHRVERQLIDTLDDTSSKTGVVVSQKSESSSGHYYSQHFNLISSLQLFAGLSDQQLQALLHQGNIRTFQKGNLLFLEGEPSNRLYIILEGWVKVLKHTVDGDETVMQMLSAGDSVLESSVFLNTTYPASAQAVEDVIVLSLPGPVFREQLKDNAELALNLLTSMSYRSQSLIRQIEYARLKSVDERVGWFLLKQMLAQGDSKLTIKLPYDKSLIASYLDMKRETFSRSLKRLKARGFKVGSNTVTLPDLKALCNFCDPDLAQVCPHHGKPDCPNPQCNKPVSVTGQGRI